MSTAYWQSWRIKRNKMTKNVYSVKQVNAYIKNMFVQDFMLNRIYVKGEVSNCKYHTSGHIYFSLKDESGAIACVMFAGDRRKGLAFRMQEGQKVIVLGSVSVYERDGRYQLYAKEIVPDGEGDLYRQFEKLKKELEEMGMFAPEFKQPIPFYSRKVGIVTAPTGAAVRDIMNISRRRNPYAQLILYPALVQGDQAAESIVKGIRTLDNYGVDVMIVGRGGGSIEDLWAFNEEIVARAIFECRTPVISAVGHETDTTIADYVADLRAPTPSAAAELAVADVRQLLDGLELFHQQLLDRMEQKILVRREQAEHRTAGKAGTGHAPESPGAEASGADSGTEAGRGVAAEKAESGIFLYADTGWESPSKRGGSPSRRTGYDSCDRRKAVRPGAEDGEGRAYRNAGKE